MMRYFSKHQKILLLLLVVSWFLRVIIVLRGGQHYWPDENRYDRSWDLLYRLAQTDFAGAVDYVLDNVQHAAFIFVGSAPALVQYATIRILGLPEKWSSIETTIWMAALVLALASVACIGLTYAVARKAGADTREGLVAALLMACTNTMFYYSRHLVPYDTSLAFALGALWVALDTRPGFRRSAICGLLAGLAFMTYNGYWLTVLIAMIIRMLLGSRSAVEVIKRGLATGLTFIALPALWMIASIARDMTPFVKGMVKFARADQQGYPPEGWSVPWEFLWHAEHGLLLIWGIGVGTVIWFCLKRSPICHRRGLLWLGVTGGCYLLMAVGSIGPTQFSVHGRTARQLVPFLSLTTACGVTCFASSRPRARRLWFVGLIALVGQALLNFTQPFMQQFPADVQRRVVAAYGYVARDVTVQGPKIEGNEDANRPAQYILLNAQHLSPIRGPKPAPAGRIVFSADHPLQFVPYLYEGGTPMVRSILRSTDISMRLVDTHVVQQNDLRRPAAIIPKYP